MTLKNPTNQSSGSHNSRIRKLNTSTLTLIALMTALLCLIGPWALTLPFSPIPFSLCTLGIYFASLLLGWKAGTISVLLYLLLGLVGLPVFTGFMGGPAKLLGPTGGYLIGYLFMALICGFFKEHFSRKRPTLILGMLISTCICYAFGSIWMALQLSLSFPDAMLIGVLPYLPLDCIKIFVAATVTPLMYKQLSRAGLLH